MKTLSTKSLSAQGALVVCVVSLFLPSVIGCRDSDKSGAAVRGRGTGQVVARMGDQEITRDELESALNKLPERRREEFRERVLNNLLETKVFAQEARKAGLEKNRQVREDIKKMTDETLARFFVKKHVDKQAEPSEEELKKYYQENKDKFVIPQSVLIQHLVTQSMQRAQGLLRALNQGASFEDLARQKSICRCWKQGGKHEWLMKGRMEPELEKAAFSLKAGKLSGIIKTGKKYQIIKVLDTRDQKEIPFEEAKNSIRSGLFRQKKNKLVQDFYQKAKVTFYPPGEHLLATIGEENISEEILTPIMSKVSENEKAGLREKWAHYLVETRVFSREAGKADLERDPEVAAEIQRKTDHILASAFQKSSIIDKVKISDQDVDSFYQSHLEEFTIPLKLRVKSIVVKTQAEAETVLKELKEGASFGALALKKSIHPSASKAGEIGWFGKGEKDPDLEKAALALKTGEISGVIKTKAGYEIIQLVDKKGGDVRPFDMVKQAIKMKLTMRRIEEEKQRYGKITIVESSTSGT